MTRFSLHLLHLDVSQHKKQLKKFALQNKLRKFLEIKTNMLAM